MHLKIAPPIGTPTVIIIPFIVLISSVGLIQLVDSQAAFMELSSPPHRHRHPHTLLIPSFPFLSSISPHIPSPSSSSFYLFLSLSALLGKHRWVTPTAACRGRDEGGEGGTSRRRKLLYLGRIGPSDTEEVMTRAMTTESNEATWENGEKQKWRDELVKQHRRQREVNLLKVSRRRIPAKLVFNAP